MAFPGPEAIRADYNFRLDDTYDDGKINAASRRAEYDLRAWLSSADFSLGKSESEPAENTPDYYRRRQIRDAFASLTMFYLYLHNTQIRPSGFHASETGANATETTRFRSPKEVLEMREQYLADAKNLIAEFAVVNFSGAIETAAVETYESGSAPLSIAW